MSLHNEGCIMAFDFGTRRIGVAIGQLITCSASPLATLNTNHEKPDWVAIGRLIECWLPERLVVGLPVNIDGSAHEISPKIERFTRQLEGRFGLPVDTVDERLSSYEAKIRLEIKGRYDQGIDAVAAQVILETWLSMHSQNLA